MSTYDDFTPNPRQGLRSPLGTPPGTPGPLGAPLPEAPSGLDLAPPTATELPPGPPPAGGDNEVDLLKAMIVTARDYLDLPTVDESERLQMEKVTSILQGLLASGQKAADTLLGTSTATRKALGGA
jgi:hypothetical protein